MAGSSALATVVCCFCNEPMPEAQATRMIVYPPDAEDESQTLFCHSRCLVKRLDPRVPLHPALDDGGTE